MPHPRPCAIPSRSGRLRAARPRQAVTRHLVALSTYLGHARVADTYWYLQATPVLLRGVAEAGETLLSGAQA